MSYFFRVYHCCFFYCTFHLLHLASTFFRVCLCMCASAKVIYCYKYLLVSFLSTFSLRFLWRTLVFFRFRFCISPCCLLFCTFFFATFALAFISSLLSSSSAPSNCLLYELRPAFERHPRLSHPLAFHFVCLFLLHTFQRNFIESCLPLCRLGFCLCFPLLIFITRPFVPYILGCFATRQ